jgi:hypothetical protein
MPTRWVCDFCGYEGSTTDDVPPDEVQCPMCGEPVTPQQSVVGWSAPDASGRRPSSILTRAAHAAGGAESLEALPVVMADGGWSWSPQLRPWSSCPLLQREGGRVRVLVEAPLIVTFSHAVL